ncbi:hypothetical protein Q31a_16590 [Aureliella helgolandensis]|uniref:Uncharacterized protein n=1 Tax=Aureliella helgolandensis TaxID=2527968 RepID=A0A518G439_9BACT|nr:hypothetical protein Q31a_16590 [Aureliella helgolandensis]
MDEPQTAGGRDRSRDLVCVGQRISHSYLGMLETGSSGSPPRVVSTVALSEIEAEPAPDTAPVTVLGQQGNRCVVRLTPSLRTRTCFIRGLSVAHKSQRQLALPSTALRVLHTLQGHLGHAPRAWRFSLFGEFPVRCSFHYQARLSLSLPRTKKSMDSTRGTDRNKASTMSANVTMLFVGASSTAASAMLVDRRRHWRRCSSRFSTRTCLSASHAFRPREELLSCSGWNVVYPFNNSTYFDPTVSSGRAGKTMLDQRLY